MVIKILIQVRMVKLGGSNGIHYVNSTISGDNGR